MIVSERFKGDKTDFQWVQHDRYGEAVRIIFEGCRKHYLERFKNDPENEIISALKNITSFDHRVLQDFHDHLAAYWRKEYLHTNHTAQEGVKEWLSWLETEICKIDTKSQVYISICFLALDKYESDHEKQVIEFLQSYAQKTYPLKWQHYLKRISAEDTMTVFCAVAILIFAAISLYSGLTFSTGPLMALCLGSIFSVGYIYATNKKLHELCMKNVFVFLIRLLLIFACSFLIALALTGLLNFQSNLILSHTTETVALMICVTSLHLIRQLWFKG